jgi:hypothetical protein
MRQMNPLGYKVTGRIVYDWFLNKSSCLYLLMNKHNINIHKTISLISNRWVNRAKVLNYINTNSIMASHFD